MLIDLHKRIKNEKIVAFQGEVGAYSEEAALEFFGVGENIKMVSCQFFKDVFELVEKGKADYGIIPIENCLEGSVGQNYDLLLKSKLKIFGEKVLRIHHSLIAKKDVKINSIKRVFSHPQALGQCREFLEKIRVEMMPVYDTAGSVKMIKEMGCEDCAAIASERAAHIYEMKILKKGIETNIYNYTRFLIISKKVKKKTGKDKTSIVFSTKHIPGALFKAMEGLAKREINLTKIESRPIHGKQWEYNFYIDFEGHLTEKRIQEALKDLKKNAIFLKILGSYPQNR